MQDPLVSVVVLTYRPAWAKLAGTLLSALRQKDIAFELVITDDGSEDNLQARAQAFLKREGFRPAVFLSAERNEGTVRNFLRGMRAARGKYIYAISPGDFFYDDTVLARMTAFAEARGAELCFGDAVFYTRRPDGTPVLPPNRPLAPCRPELYNDPRPGAQKAAFFFLDYILGAAYLRRRETAIRYTEKILPLARYAEDTPSTLLAIGDGIPVHYFPGPVVWYECAEGNSSGGNERWQRILAGEYRAAYEQLRAEHPEDPSIQAAWRYRYEKAEKEPVWKQGLRHPLVVWRFYRRRGFPVRMNEATEEHRKALAAFLKEADRMAQADRMR